MSELPLEWSITVVADLLQSRRLSLGHNADLVAPG